MRSIDIDALNEYQKILKQREQEERRRQQRRDRIDDTKQHKIYWPSEEDHILWCSAKDSQDFWRGVEAFCQFAYNNGSPSHIAPYPPNRSNSRGYAALVFKLLADKWNCGDFRIEFIEVD